MALTELINLCEVEISAEQLHLRVLLTYFTEFTCNSHVAILLSIGKVNMLMLYRERQVNEDI